MTEDHIYCVHPEYADDAAQPVPGERLGRDTQYERMASGDIVTWVGGTYYYDPEMRIEGEHWRLELAWGGHHHGPGGAPTGTWVPVYPDAFVLVDYSADPGWGKAYSYRDPSRLLRVGDLVEVPVTYGTKIGQVVGLGCDYDGPIKDVLAKVRREEL